MKRSEEFLLRPVAGKQVVVPVGKAASRFVGMLTLNDSGVFLWQLLEQEQTVQTMTQALCSRYEVTEQTAQADVEAFLEKLRSVGAIVQ